MNMKRIGLLIALCGSVIAAPGTLTAAAPPATKAERISTGEILTLHSEVLNEARTLLIRLPEGYETSGQRYPVLFLLDAEYFFQPATAAVQFLSELGYIENQIRNQPIPQLIVVGIVNVDRDRDYTPTYRPEDGPMRFPTSGHAASFLEFLETELIPLIDGRYRTHPYRILSGWSFGGLFTVHTFLTRRDLFSAYLAVSPSLWWDDQIVVKQTQKLLRDGKTMGAPLVVTLGTLEGGDMGESVRDSFVPLLEGQPAGRLSFRFVEIPYESHEYVPFQAWFDGLRAVYSDWNIPNSVVDSGFEAVRAFYDRLSGVYGYSLDIPEPVYSTMARALWQRGERAAALEMALRSAERHPRSPWSHFRLGVIRQTMGELELARDSYSRMLELVEARTVPYSEARKTAAAGLRQVDRMLASREGE